MTTQTRSVTPGWYRDPADPRAQRVHSDKEWTTQARPAAWFPSPDDLARVYGTPMPSSKPSTPPPNARRAKRSPSGSTPGPARLRRARLSRGFWVRAVIAGVVIVFGAGLVAETAWQVWGSNWWTANRQAALAAQLEETPAIIVPAGHRLADLSATPISSTAPAPTPLPPIPAVGNGEPVGRLEAPSIGLSAVVVRGTDHDALTNGPGWMNKTAFPGEAGNAVLSGHRTTYGAPFRHLDGLHLGDQLVFSTPGRPDAVYEVRDVFIVAPGDVWVAEPTPGARLTLTTCNPVGSDRERLVVQAELISGPAAQAAIPAQSWSRSQP